MEELDSPPSLKQGKGRSCLVVLFILFISSFISIEEAYASTWVVNQTINCTVGDGYFSDITSAISIANAGDTLFICPGVYTENVVVNKSVNIIGSGVASTIVRNASPGADVFNVIADWVNISSLTIEGASSSYYASIHLNGANYTNISNNNVTGSWYGIHVDRGLNNTIINNTAALNLNDGILLNHSNYTTVRENIVRDNSQAGSWGNGICLGAGENYYNVIEDNIIIGNYIGIYLETSSNNTIANNIVNLSSDSGIFIYYFSNYNTLSNNTASNNTQYGVRLQFYSNYNTVTANNASSNSYGISLSVTNYNTITNNNASSNQRGIWLSSSNNTIILDNNVSQNNVGIYLQSSDNNTLTNNTINSNSQYGLSVYSSSNNTIYNNLFNDTNNFNFAGTIYANNWNTTKQSGTNIVGGSYLGGNFWAKPDGTGFSETCTDSDSDGICDSYYNLSSGNIDWLPLAEIGGPTSVTNCTTISSPGIYVLQNDILNSTVSGACINITASNVVFNGRGYVIDGVDGSNTYGIYVYSSSGLLTNVTVKNLSVTDWEYGIYLYNISEGDIENITASSNKRGIYIEYFSNGTIINNNVSSNDYNGIDLYASNNNTIANNTASNNPLYYGIRLWDSNNNVLNNNTINSNSYGIYLDTSSNNTLTDNTADSNYDGIYLYYSDYNILGDNTITVNTDIGVYLKYSDNNSISDNNLSNNSFYGVYLENSDNNTLINNTADLNYDGVYLYYSYYNIIRSNTITLSADAGIYLYYSSDNTIYNNFFNNTNNVGFSGTTYANNWNTTKTLSANIIRGPYIGGNFWAKPDGTGFSETCTDSNSDGICDSNYTLTTSNVDYLPLTVGTTTVCPSGCDYSSIQAAINAVSPGDTIYVLAGTYIENIIVNKSVNLVGGGAEVTIVNASDSTGSVFYVVVSWVNISGFNITGAVSGVGINITGNYTNISNNYFEGNNYAIYCLGGYYHNITNNTFVDMRPSVSHMIVEGSTPVDCKGSTFDMNNVTMSNPSTWSGAFAGDYSTFVNNNIWMNGSDSYPLSGDYSTYINNTIYVEGSNSYPIIGDYSTYINNTITLIGGSNYAIIGDFSTFSGNHITMLSGTTLGDDNYAIIGSKSNYINNIIIMYGGGYNYGLLTGAGVDYSNFTNNNVTMTVGEGSYAIDGGQYGTYVDNWVDLEAGNWSYGISGSSNSNFTNNTVIMRAGEDSYAIYGGANSVFRGNDITIESQYTTYGMRVTANSTVYSNTISKGTYGIYLSSASNTTVYNNFFNNTNNVGFSGTTYANNWNTTKQSGTNIVGGSYLGGNFWAYPNGTGFSETCTDADGDGICDTYYNISSGNIDWLPLTTPAEAGGPTQIGSCTIINSPGVYVLNTSILSSGAIKCIEITSSDVIFDGQGYKIDGDDSGTDYGVYVYNSTSTLTNVTVKNLVVTDWYYGIYYRAQDGSIINNTVNSNTRSGIYLYYSSGNTIVNNTASLNSYEGIYLYLSSNNTIVNNTAEENSKYDLYVYANSDAYCNNVVENNTGSGSRPIKYYNTSVTLQDQALSELILCNADNSNIANVDIAGSDTKNNNALLALLTDSSNFINVTSSNNYYGFYLGFSNNNTIANSTASLNIQNGVYLSYSDSNTLANNTISSNTGYGVYLYSSTNNTVEYNVIDLNNGIYTETSSQVYGNIYRGNTITNASYAFYFYEGDNAEMYNMTIEDNLITNTSTGLYLDSFYFDTYDFIIKNNTIRDSSYGLYICGSYVFNFTISGNTIRDITWDGISLDSPHDNIISNNIITGCGSDGISLYSSGNAVYNNFFNNTNNVYVMGTNSWNTTKQAGTNIVGGSYLGGNFWAKPDGTGFSENCTDVDSDGICDSYYNISSGNIDWLPLTTPGGGFEVPSDVIPPVVKISNPENNSVINIFNDLVNGTVTDNVAVDTIRVILNGVEVKTWSSLGTSNTTFALAVNYTEGTNNTILVIANDTFGNTGSSTVVVTVLNRTVKKTINVTANETVTIDITNQTDTELEIFTYTNVSGDINVTAGTDIADVNVTVPMNATHGLATDEVPLGKFIAIEASDVIQQNITWAILRMYYSLVDLDRNGNGVLGDAEDVKPESLKLYWYNDSGNKWEPLIKGANYTPDGPYVYSNDVNQTPYGGYLGSVWANVSHYSVYGIAGSVYGVGGAVYGVSGAVEGEIKSQVVAEPGYIRIITGHVMSGKAKIFSIPSTVDVFVTELGFVAKKWLSGIISIETLLEKPRGVSSAPGRVFKYIDITPLQIKSDDIEAMSISFKVEKSWLEKNSIDLEAVALYRFAGTWEKLDTVKIREDDVFVYYSATSSGFSYYAISGAVKLPLETTAPVTAPPATAAPSITTLPPTPPLTAAPTLLPTTTPPPAPVLPSTLKIILILGIIAGIAAVTYYLVKRQQ